MKEMIITQIIQHLHKMDAQRLHIVLGFVKKIAKAHNWIG